MGSLLRISSSFLWTCGLRQVGKSPGRAVEGRDGSIEWVSLGLTRFSLIPRSAPGSMESAPDVAGSSPVRMPAMTSSSPAASTEMGAASRATRTRTGFREALIKAVA